MKYNIIPFLPLNLLNNTGLRVLIGLQISILFYIMLQNIPNNDIIIRSKSES